MSKVLLCKAAQGLIVSVQDVVTRLNDVNEYLVAKKTGVVSTHVLVEHVVQFGSKFNTSWATTADDEGEQSTSFLVGSSR